MMTALLVLVLPTLLAYILLAKVGLKPKSIFLKLSLSWFTGMYAFTIVAFILASLLGFVTTNILAKATYGTLLLTLVGLFFVVKDVHRIIVSLKHSGKSHALFKKTNFGLIVFCFFFSAAFFAHHLTIVNSQLLTTHIYWDFQWQMSLIQNFIYGDNFPPQNEAFAGLPHTYHYFWMIYAAIFGAAGLNLAGAINVATVIGFFFILLTLIGLAEEFFHSKLIGFAAVLLAITSSSLRFTDFFEKNEGKSLVELFNAIFYTTHHPWYFSFLEKWGVTYNGTMFNLFYILEERQMITGVVFLLLSIWIFYKRKDLSNRTLVIIGGCMGGFFLWHLQITLIVLLTLVCLLILDKERKATLYLVSGFLFIFLLHYLYFKDLTQSEWFIHTIGNYPAFNPGFSDQENQPFSWQHALSWYTYSYGLKLILIPIGLIYLWKKNRNLAVITAAIIIPTFLLINTIQLNPPTVHENHKFLRPMNFVIDFVVAVFICNIFFIKRYIALKAVGIIFLFLLTFSGILEHMTFLNSSPNQVIAETNSPLIKAIREQTPPQSVFISSRNTDLYYAGRKLFLANQLRGHDDLVLDKKRRSGIIESIYSASTVESFCKLTKSNGIDYVEYQKTTKSPLKARVESLPHVAAKVETNVTLYFVDVNKTCI